MKYDMSHGSPYDRAVQTATINVAVARTIIPRVPTWESVLLT